MRSLKLFNAGQKAAWLKQNKNHLIFAILFYKAVLCEGFDNVDVFFHFQKNTIIAGLQEVLEQRQRLKQKRRF